MSRQKIMDMLADYGKQDVARYLLRGMRYPENRRLVRNLRSLLAKLASVDPRMFSREKEQVVEDASHEVLADLLAAAYAGVQRRRKRKLFHRKWAEAVKRHKPTGGGYG